jgi:hypothetical protein
MQRGIRGAAGETLLRVRYYSRKIVPTVCSAIAVPGEYIQSGVRE